ncbi:efflux transporter outer membrane subunit [bacterium]|nr:efflux transporter outer membrane subunit [bacterium]
MKIRYEIILLTLSLTVALAGCGTTRCLPPQAVETDGLFGNTPSTGTTSLADMPWNGLFADEHLQQLIGEGLEHNFDLQIAVQKVAEAEAYLQQSTAALLPDLTAAGAGTYNRNSESINPDGPRESNYYKLGLESSWEVDIWGKLRSTKRAYYANFLYSDAGRKAVQTRLIADIASAYYHLLALDAQLAITRETVQNYIDLVATMTAMKESGKVTGAAVMQSEAMRYAAEVTIPDIQQEILETQNTLCFLVGRNGGSAIERGTIEKQPPVPVMKIGIPAMLLENRPDVMEAKFLVIKAYEMTKNAHANFYPSLTITASSGLAAVKLDELFDPGSFAANIVGGLAQPVFDKKANITRLKVARAQQEEALLNFKSTLLNAGNEVQNALGSYQSSVSKAQLRGSQLEALIQSVDYTKELLTYGSANYTEVLNAQQSLLSARLSSVNDRQQQLRAVVSLYRSLGGGWKQ